jgi:NAD-dependent SIR2 family protein deacetylase
MNIDKQIEKAVGAINEADGIIIMTGAGMGVDSGMPDFRGGQGLWKEFPKLAHLKISFVEMCNSKALATNYKLVMGWYGLRVQEFRNTTPHDGFRMLHEIANRAPKGGYVYTSNIDGHHQKAGWPEDRIVECHGSSGFMQCEKPCCGNIWPSDDWIPEVDIEECLLTSPDPLCPVCGGRARPNVMMFGDPQFSYNRETAQFWPFHEWASSLKNPVVIEVGAGIHIATVRMMGEEYAKTLIRINPRDYEVRNPEDVGIPLNGLEGISKLYEALNQKGHHA